MYFNQLLLCCLNFSTEVNYLPFTVFSMEHSNFKIFCYEPFHLPITFFFSSYLKQQTRYSTPDNHLQSPAPAQNFTPEVPPTPSTPTIPFSLVTHTMYTVYAQKLTKIFAGF